MRVLLSFLGLMGLFIGMAVADPPNIVVILADDLGYGDVQALNPDSSIKTPHMDALADSGMTFTDAHSNSAVCTPTRYGLLMGRYCWRTRLKSGVQNGYGPPLIESERDTIAETLAGLGYSTAIVGKWHLGLSFAKNSQGENDYTLPLSNGAHTHGFQESLIIPASLDFPPYVYIRDGQVTAPVTRKQDKKSNPRFLREGPLAEDFDFEGCLDRLTDEATGYIAKAAKKENPFFLYFPLTAPHKPVWPAKRFQGKSGLGPYGDFVLQVDDVVGRVTKALNDAGIRENTLVIFTSDNGSFMYRRKPGEDDHVKDDTIQAYSTDHHQANYIYRGTKADVWEAGHRVPFFVSWPERIEAKQQSKSTITHTDIYSTLMDATGFRTIRDRPEDSVSFMNTLIGHSITIRPPVVNHSANGTFALRDGEWKLVFSSGSGGRQNPKGKPFDGGLGLFNLNTDPSETKNVADSYPERVKAMTAQLAAIRGKD